MKNLFQNICIFLLLIVGACSQNEKPENLHSTTNIIAYVDTFPIRLNEIDNKIKQNLYDELSRIHLLRTTVLNNEIEKQLLKIESLKTDVPEDSILERLYSKKINKESTENYFYNYSKKYGSIAEIRQGLNYHNPNSEKGKELILKRFKDELKFHYIDSLKGINKIQVFLKPPVPPSIKLENLLVHYRGEENSEVTLLEISDFECDMCREYSSVFDSVYNDYKHLVRFGYTHYGSYVSLSAIACESASLQNKFWEIHDSIMRLSHTPDSSDIFKIAQNLELNMEKFKKDFSSPQIYKAIENNLYLLNAAGIYGTPTILINNKPLFNSSSLDDLINTLEEELAKSY